MNTQQTTSEPLPACAGSVSGDLFGEVTENTKGQMRWTPVSDESFFVYRLKAFGGKVLYVGFTNNIIKRIREHRKAGVVPFLSADYVTCKKRDEALALEKKMLKEFWPAYNDRMGEGTSRKTMRRVFAAVRALRDSQNGMDEGLRTPASTNTTNDI